MQNNALKNILGNEERNKDSNMDIESLKRGTFIEYPDLIGSNLIAELAKNLYSSVLDGIREAVSNGIDASARTIKIDYIPKEYIIIEDDGCGIEKIIDFQNLGELQKLKQREIKATDLIGMKGLGRFSYFMLGDDVLWLTNNGKEGHKIHRRLDTPFQIETDMSATRFLHHRGTRVIISELQKLRPSFILDVEKYLAKTFALILTKGLVTDSQGKIIVPSINLNGKKIQPVSKDEFEHEKHIFTLKGGVPVTGHLKEDKKGSGSVNVYVNGVLVTTRNMWAIDQSRAFSGFICCNKLTPTTARDAVVQNELSEEVLERLQEYAAKRFPKKDAGKTLNKRTLNIMKDMFAMYLKFMKLNPLGKEPKGQAGKEQEGKRKNKEKGGTERTKKPKDPNHVVIPRGPRKTMITVDKDDKGLVPPIEEVEAGQENLPVYYEPMINKIYINKTNPLHGIIFSDAINFGPDWYKKAPHFIRAATQMNPECQEMATRNITELYKYQDRMLALNIIEHRHSIIGLAEFVGFEDEAF
jgi:hypothetical protein